MKKILIVVFMAFAFSVFENTCVYARDVSEMSDEQLKRRHEKLTKKLQKLVSKRKNQNSKHNRLNMLREDVLD